MIVLNIREESERMTRQKGRRAAIMWSSLCDMATSACICATIEARV